MSNSRNIANLPNGDDAPVYACRAWVKFRGKSQSGTATASGLVTGLYTATVVSTTQFTVEYSGTTYTINTSGYHYIGDGEGVDLTVSGTTVTIDTQITKSGNVSSCLDNGSGDYTANFTVNIPANSVGLINTDATQLIGQMWGLIYYGEPSESTFRVRTYNASNSLTDCDAVHLATFS